MYPRFTSYRYLEKRILKAPSFEIVLPLTLIARWIPCDKREKEKEEESAIKNAYSQTL